MNEKRDMMKLESIENTSELFIKKDQNVVHVRYTTGKADGPREGSNGS
jgi:hypothetical protein